MPPDHRVYTLTLSYIKEMGRDDGVTDDIFDFFERNVRSSVGNKKLQFTRKRLRKRAIGIYLLGRK